MLEKLRLQLFPPTSTDPQFGRLVYRYVQRFPERSYWEGDWAFPKTGTVVNIALPGTSTGPFRESRDFYLGLPGRFDEILSKCRPELEKVFEAWLEKPLPDDIFTVLKLGGFDLEDPRAEPVNWSICFETTGNKWLGITIPFEGDTPNEPVVDT